MGRRYWREDRPKPGEYPGPWGTKMWQFVAAECWLRSMSDPRFVENMFARPDVLPMSISEVAPNGADAIAPQPQS